MFSSFFLKLKDHLVLSYSSDASCLGNCPTFEPDWYEPLKCLIMFFTQSAYHSDQSEIWANFSKNGVVSIN